MNDVRMKEVDSFVDLHKEKCPRTTERCAFLANHAPALPLDLVLTLYEVDDLTQEGSPLDKESRLVQWLLRQMTTYDPDSQNVIGLIYDKDTVLTRVVERTW